MAEKLDPKEKVTFKEILIANMVEIQAAVQLLIDKGIITLPTWWRFRLLFSFLLIRELLPNRNFILN
jgi:hypothetical protein